MRHKKIIVGSRNSQLAVAQTQIVMNEIKKHNPDLELELLTYTTTGDRILDRSLDEVGGKGLFVKELDKALIEGQIHIAVHSLKDMPMEENKDLPIVSLYKRGDPRDVLVLPKSCKTTEDMDWYSFLNGLEHVGSSSARRQLQIKKLYSGIGIKGVRGNIITRLQKLDQGEFDALVLAAAGLDRAGLTGRINRYFSVDEVIPAAGQGILSIQARSDLDISFLEQVNDEDTVYAATAERTFVRVLDGGCSSPIAAYAEVSGNDLKLIGLYYKEETKEHIIDCISGNKESAEKLGFLLADRLKGALK